MLIFIFVFNIKTYMIDYDKARISSCDKNSSTDRIVD